MTRQRDVEFSDVVRNKCPLIAEAILQVGHRQTRTRHHWRIALPSGPRCGIGRVGRSF